MVNFSPLAAEIVSLVWGTPANFNVFRVMAVLLHSTLHRESKKSATLTMAIILSILVAIRITVWIQGLFSGELLGHSESG